MLDRLQGAPHQQGGGDHDAGRRIARHHQPGTDAQHRHLHPLAKNAPQGGQRGTGRAEPLLGLLHLPVRAAPHSDCVAQHAHADQHFGVAGQRIDALPRSEAADRHPLDIGANEVFREQAQREQGSGRNRRRQPQHRVQREDHQQVDRQPRCVEQRVHGRAGKKAAHAGDVRQSRALGHGAAPSRSLQRRRQRLGRQSLVDAAPSAGQQQAARAIHAEGQPQRQQREQPQHHQGFDTAAGKHPVKHLQHVDRGHDEREVEQQRCERGQHDEGPYGARKQEVHGLVPPGGSQALRVAAPNDMTPLQRRGVPIATAAVHCDCGLCGTIRGRSTPPGPQKNRPLRDFKSGRGRGKFCIA